MTDARDEFLLKEYQRFSDSYWRTEELGEKRVNFFISLVTVVVAALAAFAKDKGRFSSTEIEWISVAAGIALLLIGVVTLLRMLRRNDVANQYMRGIDTIRDRFRDAGLGAYNPIVSLPRTLATGGLAQTVALLNSLIAGSTVAVGSLVYVRPSRIWLPAVGAFLVVLVVQFGYIEHRRGKS